MSGRGRGISNAPAWMTRQNQNQLGNGGGGGDNMGGGGGGPPQGLPPVPASHHPHPPDRDAFGRVSRGGGSGGGPPSHHYPPPPRPGGGGGGGDHPPYDDRRRYDDHRRRGGGGGGPYDDHHHRRRPDDWGGRRGGGGGRRDMHRDRDMNRDRDRDRDMHRDRRGGGGRGGGDHNNPNNNNNNNADDTISSSSREQLATIVFRSYEEEQDWAEERRRKRKARPSKFDVPPTPQQLAADAAVTAVSNPAATDFAGIPAGRDFSVVPQQTRHARRLYIGHLPPNVHEQELHDFFRGAIEQAKVSEDGSSSNNNKGPDPILSVYINHERRFCFLEFRDVAMTTACMALDGININGKGKVKVKRPNDYNPTMAPKVHPSGVPVLDVSKLGIISSNVQDGPNKVFIGGLHYHLAEAQVLELLQAFGKVKAFHLVKNEPDAVTSKGYCFVEFADPGATPVAVMGLNGMDVGGGKVLTARVAGQRGQTTTGMGIGMGMGMAVQHFPPPAAVVSSASATALSTTMSAGGGAAGVGIGIGTGASSSDRMIITGYDIESLVDAAMGLQPMPMAPTHVDQYGVPITKMGGGVGIIPPPPPPRVLTAAAVPILPTSSGVGVPPPPPPQIAAAAALPPGSSALDIANAALDAAFGPGAATTTATALVASNQAAQAPPPPPPPPPPSQRKTRILVLLNMVENEDLESDEEYKGLMEEVEEEVKKFGKLLSMQIPRRAEGWIEASAVGKIFLEYATIQDASNAEQELSGRQFGPNVVQASYHDEQEYAALKLR